MKRLLILRHAKSSWANSSTPDWERTLADRGIRDAPRVGQLLRERSLVPDLIITSDAVRARTTAQAVAQSSGCTRDIVLEPALYLAAPDTIIEVLAKLSGDSARTVLIVGHNPGLEDLIEQLTGEHHGMPTAALVQLELPIEQWSDLDDSIGATVIDTWQPKD